MRAGARIHRWNVLYSTKVRTASRDGVHACVNTYSVSCVRVSQPVLRYMRAHTVGSPLQAGVAEVYDDGEWPSRACRYLVQMSSCDRIATSAATLLRSAYTVRTAVLVYCRCYGSVVARLG